MLLSSENMELSWLANLLNISFSKAVELGIDKCLDLARVSTKDNPFNLAYSNTK